MQITITKQDTLDTLTKGVNAVGAYAKNVALQATNTFKVECESRQDKAIKAFALTVCGLQYAACAATIAALLLVMGAIILGDYLYRWYIDNNVTAEAIALKNDAEAVCEIVGTALGRHVLRPVIIGAQAVKAWADREVVELVAVAICGV